MRKRYKEGEIKELNMPLGRYRGVYEEEIQGGGCTGVYIKRRYFIRCT